MARIPRRFSAAVSQVQDKLGGFSERFSATKKPQSAAESGAGASLRACVRAVHSCEKA